MARLTVEDCWWTDPRREKLARLIGSIDLADVAALKAWRAAQTYWGKQQGWVPDYVFSALEHAEHLVQAGLAVLGDGCVYVRGSKDYLDWVRITRDHAKENGQKGGKKSAKRPRNPKGQLLPNDAKVQAPAKQKPSKPKLSVLDSDSDSGFDFGSASEVIGEPPASPVKEAIARYCEVWKARYGDSPPITGRDSGMMKTLVKDFGLAKALILIEAYLKMQDSWFLTKRHDLQTLSGNLNKVSHFASTGRVITQTEIRQIDQGGQTASQLDRIRKGEL